MTKDPFRYAALNCGSDVRQILSQASNNYDVMGQHYAESIYLLSSFDGREQVYKIGQTFVDPERRLYQLNKQFYGRRQWILRHSMYCNQSKRLEMLLHSLFMVKRIEISGYRELFRLDYDEDVLWLKSLNYIDGATVMSEVFQLWKRDRFGS